MSNNVEQWLVQLYDGKCLPERDLRQLCEMVKEVLSEESNV
jgi:serine/threonine-protein phosphatase 6 catalytic subunit